MLYKTTLPIAVTGNFNKTNKTIDGALDLLTFFLFVTHYKIIDPILTAVYPLTPFEWLANWRQKKAQDIAQLKLAQERLDEKTKINNVLSVMFPTWSSISNCVETPNGIVLPKGNKSYEFREKIFCTSLHELVRITHSEDTPCIQVVNPYFKSALRILEHIVTSPVEFKEHKEKAHNMFEKLYGEIQPLTNYKNYKEAIATITNLAPHLLERAKK